MLRIPQCHLLPQRISNHRINIKKKPSSPPLALAFYPTFAEEHINKTRTPTTTTTTTPAAIDSHWGPHETGSTARTHASESIQSHGTAQ
mmetsp:Transcript_8374/g.18007  ORF Transcript_8374/g.18007 Transcript_8374/m.18007 type:complete len:89 (-) Transcript_8374:1702-1968(-)